MIDMNGCRHQWTTSDLLVVAFVPVGLVLTVMFTVTFLGSDSEELDSLELELELDDEACEIN